MKLHIGVDSKTGLAHSAVVTSAKCCRMKNIEALIADGGDITLGAIYPIECAATAADGHNSVAMLVRREGETLNALLRRLDKAIGRYFDNDEFIDEINGA
jgi:hypothetical protein